MQMFKFLLAAGLIRTPPSSLIRTLFAYSVPSRYAGFKVKVLLYAHSLDFHGTQKLATHERMYGTNK